MKNVCIYHGGCDDGFAAALSVLLYWRRLHKGRCTDLGTLYPGVYQEGPPLDLVEDADVWIVDFSYKRLKMKQIARAARSVTVYDHHDTAEKDLKSLLAAGIVQGKFDQSQSGCMLTWHELHSGTPAPALWSYIEDRDLWRKALPDCDEVIMALRSYPQHIQTWIEELMHKTGVDRLRNEGKAIFRYYRKLVGEAGIRKHQATIKGHLVWVSNAPHYLASDVAGELAEMNEELPFGACYWHNSDGTWTFSLRSRGDFHVGRFAEHWFNGGGHLKAAGFRVNTLEEAIQ